MNIEQFQKLDRAVRAALGRHDLDALLKLEKERRGFDAGELVFVGMADIARYYWCAEKSVLANREMEPAFFAAYLYDRLLYSLALGRIKEIPKKSEDLLTVGEDLSFKDFETLIRRRTKPREPPVLFSREEKAALLNPKLSPELRKKLKRLIERMGYDLVDLERLSSEARGKVCEAFLSEKYPTLRWSFEWENFVVTGVPDGITKRFVYEFKATGKEFLIRYIRPCAFAQADLYGFFFRRKEKRVQIFVIESEEMHTWQQSVEPDKAKELLSKFKEHVEGGEAPPPRPWKCNRCEHREECAMKHA